MLINDQLIILDIEEKDRDSVLKTLATAANKAGRINDIDDYINAVLKREEQHSTAVGFGIAIPHGKTDGVSESFLAFGRVKDVEWESLDGKPVEMVFMIGVPKAEAGEQHLKILAQLSRNLMKKDFRNSINEATSKDEVLKILSAVL